MCARYTLTVPDFGALARLLLVPVDPELERRYRPRYNVAPGTRQLVLRAARRRAAPGATAAPEPARTLSVASWGLIHGGAADPETAMRHVNARSEGARFKPAFRESFAERRCVVPADGFYEWTGPKGARRPIWFHPRAGGLLHLAGLYEGWRDPATGKGIWTFTILTTDSSDAVAPVHDRMPAILDPSEVDAWLGLAGAITPEEAEALLRPAAPGLLEARAVSRRVNAVENDDPSLLTEEPAEVRPPAQVKEQDAGEDAQLALPLFGGPSGRRR